MSYPNASNRWRALPEPLVRRKDAPDPKAAEVGRFANGRVHTRRTVLRDLIEEQNRDMVTHSVGDVGRAYLDAKKKTGRQTADHYAVAPHAVEWADPVGEEAAERADIWREVLRLQSESEDEEDVA